MRQDWIEEHGREPDAQQLHDAMMSNSAPAPTETESDGLRAAELRIAKAYRNNPQMRDEALAKVRATQAG